MSRKFIWVSGEGWVPKAEYQARKAASKLQVITDETGPFKSMADGKVYTSKSRYRAEMKARGFVELGNDEPSGAKPSMPDTKPDIERALSQLGYGS